MRTFCIFLFQMGFAVHKAAKRVAYPLLVFGRACQVEKALPGLVRLFDSAGIPYWLGGGIAYDAIRGYRSRPHKDIDISILAEHQSRVVEMLRAAGYEVRMTRPTSFFARRRGLKIDLFSWHLNGGMREMLYDSEIASAPAELFEDCRVENFAGVDLRITPPEIFHLFLPLIKHPADQEFVRSCSLAPRYQMVENQQQFSISLPGKRIESAPDPSEMSAGIAAAPVGQDSCAP
ncbi:MAG: nucleotidyltransferase family protein [Planctomycetales bacterium]|nr:nucleotidyltransferase family protein [Planctomycetales bacterium]